MLSPDYPKLTPEFAHNPFEPIGEMYRQMLGDVQPGSTTLLAFSDVLETQRIRTDMMSPRGYSEGGLSSDDILNAARLALVEETIRNRMISSDAAKYRPAKKLAEEAFSTSQELVDNTDFKGNGRWSNNNAIIQVIDKVLNDLLDNL